MATANVCNESASMTLLCGKTGCALVVFYMYDEWFLSLYLLSFDLFETLVTFRLVNVCVFRKILFAIHLRCSKSNESSQRGNNYQLLYTRTRFYSYQGVRVIYFFINYFQNSRIISNVVYMKNVLLQETKSSKSIINWDMNK